MEDLAYKSYKGHVTNEMLNSAYGKFGKTFDTEDAAINYSKGYPSSRIYQLWDYRHKDVEPLIDFSRAGRKIYLGIKIADGARKHCIGWLVQTC